MLALAQGLELQAARRPALRDRHASPPVLEKVAKEIGWGKGLPKGQGLGLACHFTFGGYAAHAFHVAVTAKGELAIRRAVCAVDVGRPINPLGIRAQMEGGTIDGLSTALHLEITVKEGRVVQSNFHDYPLMKMVQAPDVEVHVIDSTADPKGCGEMGIPTVAPRACERDLQCMRRAAAQASDPGPIRGGPAIIPRCKASTSTSSSARATGVARAGACGSSPSRRRSARARARPGPLAAIRDDGILVGSVSGGCIEDDLVARRGEYAGRQPHFATYGVTSEEARRFGLPCGGELEVIVEPEVRVDEIEGLLARIAAGEIVARHVDLATGAWRFAAASPTDECERTADRFTSIHGPRWRMLVIGASEIAHYLAEVASTVDFQVFVCDPREEYRSAWRARDAKWIDGMPDDAVVAFRADGHSVILTVSHDPKLDDMALLEALKTDAFYVGAVGSKQTSAERRKRLADFDLTPQQIARLRGPVGLAIGSRTPPEIALSILADLVATRNGIVLEKSQAQRKRA
jgi:xanthine dehydrogenase accessory factor